MALGIPRVADIDDGAVEWWTGKDEEVACTGVVELKDVRRVGRWVWELLRLLTVFKDAV